MPALAESRDACMASGEAPHSRLHGTIWNFAWADEGSWAAAHVAAVRSKWETGSVGSGGGDLGTNVRYDRCVADMRVVCAYPAARFAALGRWSARAILLVMGQDRRRRDGPCGRTGRVCATDASASAASGGDGWMEDKRRRSSLVRGKFRGCRSFSPPETPFPLIRTCLCLFGQARLY